MCLTQTAEASYPQTNFGTHIRFCHIFATLEAHYEGIIAVAIATINYFNVQTGTRLLF